VDSKEQRTFPQYRFSILYWDKCLECDERVPHLRDFEDCVIEYDERLGIEKVHFVNEFHADGVLGSEGSVRGPAYKGIYSIIAYRRGDTHMNAYVGRFPNNFDLNPPGWGSEIRRGEVQSCIDNREKAVEEFQRLHVHTHAFNSSPRMSVRPGTMPGHTTIILPGGPRSPLERKKPPLKKGEVYYDPGGEMGGQWRVSDGKVFVTGGEMGGYWIDPDDIPDIKQPLG